MKARAAIISCAACLAACHEITALPGPPLTSDTQALVLVVSNPDRPTSVRALKKEPDGTWLLPDVFARGAVEIEALAYNCPLERLGLVPGPQDLKEKEHRTDVMPLPAIFSVLHGSPGQESSWSEGQLSDRAKEALRRLPVESDNLCRATMAELKPKVLEIDPDGRNQVEFMVAIDDKNVLIGSENGYYYRVDGEGKVYPISPFDQGLRVRAGYRADDDQLWLIAEDGRLLHGTIEGGFTTTATLAPLGPIDDVERMAIAGPHGDPGAPFELFVETDSRAFLRFDGEGWTTLATYARSELDDNHFVPAVVWKNRNEVVTIGVGHAQNTVVRYRNGEIREQVLDGPEGVASLRLVPGLGLLLGRDNGGLFIEEGEGWRHIATSELLYWVRTILPLEDGFVFGASTKKTFMDYGFGQVFSDTGVCPSQQLTDFAAVHLARIEDTFIAATASGDTAAFGITLLDVVTPPHSCSRSPDPRSGTER